MKLKLNFVEVEKYGSARKIYKRANKSILYE